MAQKMTAAEWVEYAHRVRGEPTYAELQAINADLLKALSQMVNEFGCYDDCRWFRTGQHDGICDDAHAVIAKAKGETPCAD